MWKWLEQHPATAVLAAIAVLYGANELWHGGNMGLVEALAVIAFGEAIFLWAEVGRLRRKLDDLESRTSRDPERAAGAIATLWERVGELLSKSRSLESRTDACEKLIGALLSKEVKDAS
ncbi:MAG: hypothetical protein WBQ34_13445 [Candidatus Acidiferrales bacterium]